jgi:hypothetical protein
MTSSRIDDRLARFSSLSRESGGLASGPKFDDAQLGTVIPGRAQREPGIQAASPPALQTGFRVRAKTRAPE